MASKPPISDEHIAALMTGTLTPKQGLEVLDGILHLADTYVAAVRFGLDAGDAEAAEEIEALSTGISCELMAASRAIERAERAQHRIPFAYGYAGAADPFNGKHPGEWVRDGLRGGR